MNTELIGDLAGTLTTLAFIPQVIKVWRSRSASDVSLLTFAALTLGTVLWAAYGILIDAKPTIIANVVTFGLVMLVLGLKYRFRKPI